MTTIFATINNVRNSAVCTVRISGTMARDVLRFIPFAKNITHKEAKYAKIYDADGSLLDDVIVLFFEGPKSFTGEDVIEISFHASTFIVGKFLENLAKIEGFAHAKAGEFCYRAVLNNKLTINKAEAMNKLIQSESSVQHRLAIKEIGGEFEKYYDKIKNDILNILMLLETYIDFAEDENISLDFITKIQNINNSVIHNINHVLKCASMSEKYDIRIVILGRPNVGKSSLFNKLVLANEAIISDIAGTTRDLLKKSIVIAGFKVELIDTAGIHESTDKVESIGIEKAQNIAKTADIILLLQERDGEFVLNEKYTCDIINVFTKTDLYGIRPGGINISDENISELENTVYAMLNQKFSEMQNIGFLCNERQRNIFIQTVCILQKINFKMEAEILSEEFRRALHHLSFLVGGIDVEEIFDEIFSNFCIGK